MLKLGHVCRAKLGGGPQVEIKPSASLPTPTPQTGTFSWRPGYSDLAAAAAGGADSPRYRSAAVGIQPAAQTLDVGRPSLDVEQCGPALATIERLDEADCSVASSTSTAYVEPSPPPSVVSTALALHQLPAGADEFDLRAGGAPEPHDSEVQGPMVVPLSAVCSRQPSQEDEMAAHRVLLLKKDPAVRREFSTV